MQSVGRIEGKAGAELVRLEDERAALVARGRAYREKEVAARAEVVRLTEELVIAAGQGRDAEKPVEQKLARAQARADEPWAARTEAMRRAVLKAENAYLQAIVDGFGELAAVLTEEHRAIRDRLVASLSESASLIGEWHAAGQRFTALLVPVPGLDGQAIPRPGTEELRRELAEVLARGVPVPAPAELADDDELDDAA